MKNAAVLTLIVSLVLAMTMFFGGTIVALARGWDDPNISTPVIFAAFALIPAVYAGAYLLGMRSRK